MSGFIGSHLTRALLEAGDEVHGIYNEAWEMYRLEGVEGHTIEKCDIRDREKVKTLIEQFKPDRIYHLAAQSFPTVSYKEPTLTMDTNSNGTINVFETVRELDLDCRIFVACSSAEYGLVTPDDVPTPETHPLKPLHPYGVSKVAQDLLAYQYFKNYGMDTVRGRIFNTTGPMKTNDVASDFTKQVASIEKGLQDPVMRVGNLSGERDITDVRDMVRAFQFSMEKGVKGQVYNLCSSKAICIQDLLDEILVQAEVEIKVEKDPALMRPTDEPIIMGDNTRFRTDTGWAPEVPIKDTVKDMLDFWRGHL